MIPALAGFAGALRAEGLSVSPGELLDAARAIEAAGPEDRGRFRAALAATLAKDRRSREVFERVFDRFFLPPARAPREGKGERGGAGRGGERKTRLGEAPAGKPSPRKERDETDRRRRGRRDDEERRDEVASALRAIRERRGKREGKLRRAPEPRPGEKDLVRTITARPDPGEDAALALLVPRVVETLRLTTARRLRRSRRGRLAIREVFRESLARGGVPFVLPRKRPRTRPTKVVLLVDVSWSTARLAGYFLEIATAFLEPGRKARVVAFVDRPVDATAEVVRLRRRRRAGSREGFGDLLRSLPGVNPSAPSDYGRALHALATSRLRPGGRDTVLVVLGDARTNRFDPLPWALEDLARACRAVLWLVAEPESRWGTADSALAAYLPHVDVVVEAKDLSGLARGVRELLHRL